MSFKGVGEEGIKCRSWFSPNDLVARIGSKRLLRKRRALCPLRFLFSILFVKNILICNNSKNKDVYTISPIASRFNILLCGEKRRAIN